MLCVGRSERDQIDICMPFSQKELIQSPQQVFFDLIRIIETGAFTGEELRLFWLHLETEGHPVIKQEDRFNNIIKVRLSKIQSITVDPLFHFKTFYFAFSSPPLKRSQSQNETFSRLFDRPSYIIDERSTESQNLNQIDEILQHNMGDNSPPSDLNQTQPPLNGIRINNNPVLTTT